MTDHEMFYTARVACDSLGNKVVPSNAISVGTIDPVAESTARKRALDARERQLNEQKHDLIEWRAALHEQRVRMDDASAAHRDAIKRGLLADALSRLDALAARIDAFEEQRRANDPDNQITLPPGITADEGELQAQKEPNHQCLEPNPDPVEPEPPDPPQLIEGDGDGDPGAVLPRAPISPVNRYYDPHPEPVSKLNLPTSEE
jgi:hypothetical protein